MKKIAFALTALAFLQAQELEVEGNLKVQGNIDASNQRVTNVGIPTELTDAVNTEFLQEALRDDGNYEYMFFYVSMGMNPEGVILMTGYLRLDQDNFQPGSDLNSMADFNTEITNLINEGWQMDSINNGGGGGGGGTFYGHSSSWWIFKRPLEQ